MSVYPAGSYRVDIHIEWVTGETGDFDTTVTHMDATADEILAEAMRGIIRLRGDELPTSPYTWTGFIS